MVDPTIRILLVRSWVVSAAPVRAVLHAAGMIVTLIRVDLESSLEAAMIRGDFHVVVVDPDCTTLSLATVTAMAQTHKRTQPIVVLGELAKLPSEIAAALTASSN